MRSALVMVLALVAAACSSPTSPTAGLKAETKVSATTLRPGESVTVSVVVSNHGTTSQRINLGTCPAPFVVTTAIFTVVGPAEHPCLAVVPPTADLAPGESLTITSSWYGDARAGKAQLPGHLLPAGRYLVQARVVTERGIVAGRPVEIVLTR